ncbi:MAG: InlB B-repeat-containing protein, partial [Oscillospiraceae bacterium]|nr:InlB B-repeat-containing protein [Oscillospiraceae bacterium]
TITGDLTLYAQWTPEVTYTVIYDANGGTGGHTDDLVAGTVYTILDEAQSGVFLLFFVLASWNTSPDGSGTTYLPGEQIIIDRNLVLYAQWEFEV